MRWRIISFLGLVLCLASCQKSRGPAFRDASVFATHEKHLLKIAKTAQEKEFLMYAYVFDKNIHEYPEAISPRLIYFKPQGEKLMVIESGKLHHEVTSLQYDHILFDYKIVVQDDVSWTIDLSSVKQLFLGDSAAAGSETSDREHLFSGASVVSSVIQRSLVKTPGEFRYEAVHQIEKQSKTSEKVFSSVRLMFFYKKYEESKTFVGANALGTEQHFFRTHPRAETEKNEFIDHRVKIDTQKRLTFKITSKVPPKYIPAFKAAVDYWNRALGKEVIVLEMAGKDEDLFSTDSFIIDWVWHRKATKANAHWVIDPVSGEVLHGRIYFPSVFEEIAKEAWRKEAKDTVAHSHSARCDHGIGPAFLWLSLASVVREQLQQDYITAVAAHEMGHILGLRHNFAASTQGEMSYAYISKAYSSYLLNPYSDQPKKVTASVMDYHPAETDVLIGKHLRERKPVFDYDVAAVRGLYAKEEAYRKHVFCTDEQVQAFANNSETQPYADCLKDDAGTHPVEQALHIWNQARREFLPRFIGTYLTTLRERKFTVPLTLEQVGVNPADEAYRLVRALSALVPFAHEEGDLIATKWRYPYLTHEEIYESNTKQFQAWLAPYLPLENHFRPWSKTDVVQNLLNFDKAFDGAANENEKKDATIKLNARHLFEQYLKEVSSKILHEEAFVLSWRRINDWISDKTPNHDKAIDKDRAPFLLDYVFLRTSQVLVENHQANSKFLMYRLSTEFLPESPAFSVPLLVPSLSEYYLVKLQYPFTTRFEFASLFAKMAHSENGYGYQLRQRLHKNYYDSLEELAGKNFEVLKAAQEKNFKIKQWFIEQDKIGNLIKPQ